MPIDKAETGRLQTLLSQIGEGLDEFLKFEHPDALHPGRRWREHLDIPLPREGIGIDAVTAELLEHVVPNGSSVPRPGFSSFITTGGTTAATLASTAASIAAPQRYGHTAFNFLEELSLRWLADLFGLPEMQGVYSSGGSVANLLALGAARQWTLEQRGVDPAQDGLPTGAQYRIYASTEAHRTIHRSAAVLGLGRNSVREIATDDHQRLDVHELETALKVDRKQGIVPIAVVGIAGTTNTGAIDPLEDLLEVGRRFGAWVHVDGAYGLPAAVDPEVEPKIRAVAEADSAIVDPHKWLATGIGVAATFVREPGILQRAFAEGEAAYIDTSFATDSTAVTQFDSMGVNWADMGVELSAPPRGVHVWAVLREIGRDGFRDRVRRHRQFAQHVTRRAERHPRLEALTSPELSIACLRYRPNTQRDDLDALTDRILGRLRRETDFVPTATIVNGALAIRPCFINPRTTASEVDGLVDALVRIGDDETR